MNEFDQIALESLLADMLEGDLAPIDRQRLAAILKESDEARQFYLDYCEMHVSLEHQFGHVPETSALQGETASLSRRPLRRAKRSRFKAIGVWALGLAAAAALLLIVANVFRGGSAAKQGVFVAKVVQSKDAVVDHEVAAASRVNKGSYELTRGVVEYETDDGTTLLIEAPAKFDLLAANRMRLDRGRVTVKMKKGESGFVVDGPHVQVTDLGTEFGVETLRGETEVHVFEGEVEVKPTDDTDKNSTMAPRQLTAGDAVRLGVVEAEQRWIDIANDPNRFLRSGSQLTSERLFVYPRLINGRKPLANYRMRPDDKVFRCDQSKHNGTIQTGEGNLAAWSPGLIGAGMRVGEPSKGRGAIVPRGLPINAETFSILLWIKPKLSLKESGTILTIGDEADKQSRGFFALEQSADELQIRFRTKSGAIEQLTTQLESDPPSDWHFVAIVHDGDGMHAFINGAEQNALPKQATPLASLPITLASESEWCGQIDELAFLNSAFEEPFIGSLYSRFITEDLPKTISKRNQANESD